MALFPPPKAQGTRALGILVCMAWVLMLMVYYTLSPRVFKVFLPVYVDIFENALMVRCLFSETDCLYIN